MRVAILCHKDFSGNMYNLASSVNEFTKHKAVMIKADINSRLQYPTMVLLGRKLENIKAVHKTIYSSDVIVLKESHELLDIFRLDKSKLRDKKIIILLGGWGFRSQEFLERNYRTYNNINDGVKWAVTSIDFLQKEPWMGWIPPCVRINYLRVKYKFLPKLTPPLIVTSPSHSGSAATHKNFNLLISQLRKRIMSGRFQVKLISDVTNDICLKEKAQASIFFDRLFDIYGINSQEAGAFESVVVTGSSKFVRNKLTEEGFDCPFIFVGGAHRAANEIVRLLNYPVYLRRKRRECYRYVKRLHSGKQSVTRLFRIIRSEEHTLPKSLRKSLRL